MALSRVALHGFRSFQHAEIGPLGRFTCIIGCNGHGKSVLGDAVHFVLRGLQGSRFSDVANQELQRIDSCRNDQCTPMSVTLTFVLPADRSDHSRGKQQCVQFTRSCNSASSRCTVTMRDRHGQEQLLSERS